MSALAAFISPARADLELCNRTSFIIESAVGIEEQGVAATRGWFRVDPGVCRTVLRGEFAADQLYVHARPLPVYGAVKPLHPSEAELCVGEAEFLIAGARRCSGEGQRLVRFGRMSPRPIEHGSAVFVTEPADYGAEQARLAAVQRLLTLAGYDAEPIDGVAGPRTDAALASFRRERSLLDDAVTSPALLDALIDAVREGAGPGLLWCNETSHTVMAALGVDEDGSLVTRGWWRVAPGACVRPDLPSSVVRAGRSTDGANDRSGGRVYSFAEAVDAAGAVIKRAGVPLAWGGDKQLCVRNTRFEIREHDDCMARGLAAHGFRAVDLSGRAGATVRFREP